MNQSIKATIQSANRTEPDIIVSFTSFPARIHCVPQVLKSLYAQTKQPDRIMLYLAEEQFPRKESDLPRELVEEIEAGRVELRWCDNLGSHKKYYYVMQEFPDEIIITVDDDRTYHPDMIKTLYEMHLDNPTCVVALSAKMIMFDQSGKVRPYKDWLYFCFPSFPSLRILGTGGDGILYPPHALSPNVFDKKAIIENCRYNDVICGDDLWLKMHGILLGTKTVTWNKRAFFQPEMEGAKAFTIGKLSTDQLQHEQVLRFLLKRHGTDNTKTVEEILIEQELTSRDSGIHLEEDYLKFSYADDVCFVLINNLERHINKQSKRQSQKTPSITVEYLLFLLRFANGIISRAGLSSYNVSLEDLRKTLFLVPNIAKLSKRSFDIRVFLQGEFLLANLGARFGQAIDYLQMLKNWESFLECHRDCDFEYKQQYACFLYSMKTAALAMLNRGYFLDEGALLKQTFEEKWRGLSVKDRAEIQLYHALLYARASISGIIPEKIKSSIKRVFKNNED